MQSQVRTGFWSQVSLEGFLAPYFVVSGVIYPNFYENVLYLLGYVPTKFGKAAPNICWDNS